MSIKSFFRKLTGNSRVVETPEEASKNEQQEDGCFESGVFGFPGDLLPENAQDVKEASEKARAASRAARGGLRIADRGVSLCLVPSLAERGMVYRLGAGMRSAEDPMLAIELWRASLELQPDDPMGWLYLGQLLLQQQSIAEAESAFLHARHCDPQNGVAVGMLAFVATTREDWPQAVRLYNEAVALCPTNEQLLRGLAISQERAGLHEESLTTERKIRSSAAF